MWISRLARRSIDQQARRSPDDTNEQPETPNWTNHHMKQTGVDVALSKANDYNQMCDCSRGVLVDRAGQAGAEPASEPLSATGRLGAPLRIAQQWFALHNQHMLSHLLLNVVTVRPPEAKRLYL